MVCFQVEAQSYAVSFRRRGAGAAGRRRRRRRRPKGGWLRHHGVEDLASSDWRCVLCFPLPTHLRLSGNQNQTGHPGARKHQHQEEAEDLWDQGEGIFETNIHQIIEKKINTDFVSLLMSDRGTPAFCFWFIGKCREQLHSFYLYKGGKSFKKEKFLWRSSILMKKHIYK